MSSQDLRTQSTPNLPPDGSRMWKSIESNRDSWGRCENWTRSDLISVPSKKTAPEDGGWPWCRKRLEVIKAKISKKKMFILSELLPNIVSSDALDSRHSPKEILPLAEELVDFFASKEAYLVYPDALAFLRSLSKDQELRSRVKLGVITNNGSNAFKALESLEIRKYFDFAVCSESKTLILPFA